MKITIQNFRYYQGPPSVFHFKSGCITHLAGGSGGGKTTILRAITWVLYGGLRGNALKPVQTSAGKTARAISPNGSRQEIELACEALRKFGAGPSATAVILELPDFSAIIRRKAAATSAVEVELDSPEPKVLRGDSATSWIERSFGTLNLWLSSSSLPQGGRSPLLTLSNAEKFALLYELTFGSVLPASDTSTTELTSEAVALASATETSPAPFVHVVTVATNSAKNAARGAAAKAAGARDNFQDVQTRFGTFSELESGDSPHRDLAEIDAYIAECNRFIDSATKDLATSAAIDNKRRALSVLLTSAKERLSQSRTKVLDAQRGLSEAQSDPRATSYAETLKAKEILENRAAECSLAVSEVELAKQKLDDAESLVSKLKEKVGSAQKAYDEVGASAPTPEQIRSVERYLAAQTRAKSESRLAPIWSPTLKSVVIATSDLIRRTFAALRTSGAPAPWQFLCKVTELATLHKELSKLSLPAATAYAVRAYYLDVAAKQKRRRSLYRKCRRALVVTILGSDDVGEVPSDLEGLRKIEAAVSADLSRRGHLGDIRVECGNCGKEISLCDGGDAKPVVQMADGRTVRFADGTSPTAALELIFSLVKAIEGLNPSWPDLDSRLATLSIDSAGPDPADVAAYIWGAKSGEWTWDPTKALDLYNSLISEFGTGASDRGAPWCADLAKLFKCFGDSPVLDDFETIHNVLSEVSTLKRALPSGLSQLAAHEIEDSLRGMRKAAADEDIAFRILSFAKSELDDAVGVSLRCQEAHARARARLKSLETNAPTPNELKSAEAESVRAVEFERKIAGLEAIVNSAKIDEKSLLAEANELADAVGSLGQPKVPTNLRQNIEEEIASRRARISEAHQERATAMRRAEVRLAHSRYLAAIKGEEATAAKLAAGSEAVRIVASAATRAILDLVNAVTVATNTILADIFPENSPMSISLELAQKGGAVTSAAAGNAVSLIVNHRGTTYDGAGLLSGGETDRLSFALTVALACAAHSPFVLLDECFSSLDDETQDLCFSALRKYLPGKTIINVCHSSVTGAHDDLVVAGGGASARDPPVCV